MFASGFFMPHVAKSPNGNTFSTRLVVSTNPSRICIAYRDTENVPPAWVRRAGLFAGTDFMPSAIEQIVDTYVRLKNRRGLDELMMHRQRLAVDLKSRSGFDFSLPIGKIDEEIAIIEAGLSRLKADSAGLGATPPV